MTTFKQFLEEYDPLGSLPVEMVFRKLGLNSSEATAMAKWWEGELSVTDVDDAAWYRLVNLVDSSQEFPNDTVWDDQTTHVIKFLRPIMLNHGVSNSRGPW